ncbi:hypothetical protein [Bacillus infantis]
MSTPWGGAFFISKAADLLVKLPLLKPSGYKPAVQGPGLAGM